MKHQSNVTIYKIKSKIYFVWRVLYEFQDRWCLWGSIEEIVEEDPLQKRKH